MGVFNKKQGMFAFQLPGGSEMADPEGIAREAGSLIGSGSTFFFPEQADVHTAPKEDLPHRWACPEYEPTFIMAKVTF